MRTITSFLALGLVCLFSYGCSSNTSNGPSSNLHAQNNRGQINNNSDDDSKQSAFDTGVQPTVTAETHFAAGQLSETQGNVPNAIAQYQEALKLDPNHLGSLYRLGVCYTQIKDYPNAIDCWKRYVDATHGSAQACNNLGFCYEVSGDAANAEMAYKKGIAADPKNVECRVNYGLMLARQEHISDAIVQWQAVLKPAEIHYNLGSVYEMEGRPELAKQEYTKALQLDPTLQDAHQRIAALDQ
jgi:tetratricopeptide (TPR) repeat protein